MKLRSERQHRWYVYFYGLCIVLFQCVNGTGYWTNTNASIATVDFVSGVWSTSTTCFLVGYNDLTGAIIQSIDGGTTWKNILVGTTKTSQISDISSYTTSTGTTYVFAVSLSGDVWVSANGGTKFTTIGSAIPAQLYGSAVGSNGNSFAVGIGQTTPYPTKIYRSSLASTTAAPYTVWSDFTPHPPSPALGNDSLCYSPIPTLHNQPSLTRPRSTIHVCYSQCTTDFGINFRWHECHHSGV